MIEGVRVGFMYSDNNASAPHDERIDFGWPTGITYASIINGILDHGGIPYNLRWNDLDEDLNVRVMYNLKCPEKISGGSLEDHIDVLCFMGFGNVGDVRENDKEITHIVRKIGESGLPTINPSETVLRAREQKKHYLLDLFNAGFSVPETYLARSFNEFNDITNYLLDKFGAYVTKPISGFGGYCVEKFPGGDFSNVEKILRDDGQILVQEYIDNICETGERSVFLFDGEVKYVVLKKAEGFKTNITGNIQGVKRSLVECSVAEEKLAKEIREFVAPESLIARADLIGTPENPIVGELTLSSIGLHTAVFKGMNNLSVEGYVELINKLVRG